MQGFLPGRLVTLSRVPVTDPIAASLPRPVARGSSVPAAGEDAPAWSRPALIAVVALAAALMLIDTTRSGYGNSYYATGALAASHSWSALFYNAADLGGYVSLDKGPLPDWLIGSLRARVRLRQLQRDGSQRAIRDRHRRRAARHGAARARPPGRDHRRADPRADSRGRARGALQRSGRAVAGAARVRSVEPDRGGPVRACA